MEDPKEVQSQGDAANSTTNTGSVIDNYLSTLQPISLKHFLRFPDNVSNQSVALTIPAGSESEKTLDVPENEEIIGYDGTFNKPERKKKYKKKLPEIAKPKLGLISSVTALDGISLYCCLKCNMAYSEEKLLNEHLVSHKAERKFICNFCGAGLKTQDHLQRHKRGHNPDGPFL